MLLLGYKILFVITLIFSIFCFFSNPTEYGLGIAFAVLCLFSLLPLISEKIKTHLPLLFKKILMIIRRMRFPDRENFPDSLLTIVLTVWGCIELVSPIIEDVIKQQGETSGIYFVASFFAFFIALIIRPAVTALIDFLYYFISLFSK